MVLLSGNKEDVLRDVKEGIIYRGREIKMIYSLLNFSSGEIEEEVLSAMKENFRKEGLKARFKGVGGTVKMQSGSIALGSPSKIMRRDMNYFVFGHKEIEFGILEACADVREAEKREMEKPERRKELAISPRLSRILINLSQVRKNETLLDPFCGIGAIVQEALLMGINAVGIEINSDAAANAKKNIEWLMKNYKIGAEWSVINQDSRKVQIREEIGGIATEPSFGKLLKKMPAKEEAENIIEEFEKLMTDVLNNVKEYIKKGGKIAFTSPLIKINAGKIGCNIERICNGTGLEVYELKELKETSFPIQEFREGQIVGREFYVLN
jgi:tRNA G10  N-methylase Trm11